MGPRDRQPGIQPGRPRPPRLHGDRGDRLGRGAVAQPDQPDHEPGSGAGADRRLRDRELHPDRRRDQLRQLGRADGEPARAGGRHQFRDDVPDRRLPGVRFRDPDRPGARGNERPDRLWPGQARPAGRARPVGGVGGRGGARPAGGGRSAGTVGDRRHARREGRAPAGGCDRRDRRRGRSRPRTICSTWSRSGRLETASGSRSTGESPPGRRERAPPR